MVSLRFNLGLISKTLNLYFLWLFERFEFENHELNMTLTLIIIYKYWYLLIIDYMG